MLLDSICKTHRVTLILNVVVIIMQVIFLTCLALFRDAQTHIELEAHAQNRYDFLIKHAMVGTFVTTCVMIGIVIVQLIHLHRQKTTSQRA